MRVRKFIAPWALAAAFLSGGLASADGGVEIRFFNGEDTPRAVEYRIGNFRDCQKNSEYVGSVTIPPKGRWTIQIKDENTCCVRVVGSTKWNVNAIGRERKYEFKIH
jgi:hypothetical protein